MKELRFSEYCANCRKKLSTVEKVFFVEKELGRCFCAEECIRDYFQPIVEFMEEELQRLKSESAFSDFTEEQREKLSHYKTLTLQDPDEIWLDQTESGERHFIFISHFRIAEERFSYVVVCLTIEGRPSYVFLSFPTKSEDLVTEYRRGVDLRVNDDLEPVDASVPNLTPVEAPLSESSDLGESEDEKNDDAAEQRHFSDVEQLYLDRRRAEDISRDDFPKYEGFIEPTMDDPDEIWRLVDDEANEWYTFIANHQDEEGSSFFMVVICQAEIEDDAKSFEVFFAFPTVDPSLVQYFRKGIISMNKAFGVSWTRSAA